MPTVAPTVMSTDEPRQHNVASFATVRQAAWHSSSQTSSSATASLSRDSLTTFLSMIGITSLRPLSLRVRACICLSLLVLSGLLLGSAAAVVATAAAVAAAAATLLLYSTRLSKLELILPLLLRPAGAQGLLGADVALLQSLLLQ
jgi:hypothetical protein